MDAGQGADSSSIARQHANFQNHERQNPLGTVRDAGCVRTCAVVGVAVISGLCRCCEVWVTGGVDFQTCARLQLAPCVGVQVMGVVIAVMAVWCAVVDRRKHVQRQVQ